MTKKRMLALGLIVPFTVLSVYAVMQVGYWGLIDYQRYSPAGWQVLADLVIAIVLAASWMIADARRTGRTVWPYLLVCLFLGSFGPLAYLLLTPDHRPAGAIA